MGKKKVSPIVITPNVPQAEKPVDHIHQWEILMKNYASPTNSFLNASDTKTIEKALFGFTTLLFKCTCSETKQEEVLGTDENQLDQVCAKALEFGPQYIQNGDNTYVVAKWQPPVQQSGNLPLR